MSINKADDTDVENGYLCGRQLLSLHDHTNAGNFDF